MSFKKIIRQNNLASIAATSKEVSLHPKVPADLAQTRSAFSLFRRMVNIVVDWAVPNYIGSLITFIGGGGQMNLTVLPFLHLISRVIFTGSKLSANFLANGLNKERIHESQNWPFNHRQLVGAWLVYFVLSRLLIKLPAEIEPNPHQNPHQP